MVGASLRTCSMRRTVPSTTLQSFVLERLLSEMREGAYVVALMTPPRSMFWAEQPQGGHGQGPLRGRAPPDIYGVKGLSDVDKESARLETALALRS
eukprot:8374838-Alexandrium_andersonii.AAC.1